MASSSIAQDPDVLAAHFGNDRASLEAFLKIQVEDLQLLTDVAAAQEVAEASLLDAEYLSDAQLAQQLAEADELQWARAQHDRVFAQELSNAPADEWEEVGDLMECSFDPGGATMPDSAALGFRAGQCGICMEFADYLTIVGICSHAFCHGCLKQYVTLKVKERSAPLRCCGVGCQEYIDLALVKQVAGKPVADAHERDLAEAAIQSKVFCPYPNCGAAYDLEDGATQVQCLACHRMFCGSCRVPWHQGLTCEQYTQLPDYLRAPEDVALLRMARRKQWRPCPGCRNLLSKQDGDCNWMRCICGCAFCFRCGNKYINNREQPDNVHGRAGCTCPLFDPVDEPNVNNAGDDQDLLIPPPPPPPPPPAVDPQEQQPGGLFKFGNAKMRRHQFVDLVAYKARIDAGTFAPAPQWLQTRMERNECCYCARTFTSLEALNQHLSMTRNHPVYACCGRIFLDENGFRQHAELHRRKKNQ